tara:strand:- start:1 stop:1059 length:1059 start_codon:yes stop_codon:yes gene_type:complete
MKSYYFFITIILIFISFLFCQKPYRGAEYRTMDEFLYGRFEVKMKTAVGSGIVSSFFTIDDYWANGQSSTSNWREIDFEALGNLTNAIQTNIITAYETHHEEIINTPFYPYESFHVYAFEWTPVSIKFFIDDELVRQDYNDYVSTHNTGQKIMMNIWQPIWENWVGAFDETILPVYAYYDWVKYYSYTPGEGTYGSFNNFSFSWEDNFDFFNNQIWQKATHSWSANNAQFVQQNAVLQDGYLILCLTDNLSYGYSGGELSVLENSSEEKAIFQISPNPFNSSFIIIPPKSLENKISEIVFYNIKGNEVLRNKGNLNDKININFSEANLSTGIYFLKIVAGQDEYQSKITYLR